MKKRLVDTNVVIRHLVQDSPALASRAQHLFDASDRGELLLVILPEVLAECVFVLESYYNHPRAAIAAALETLITSPGVKIGDRAIHVDALRRYVNNKSHFVDCALAATAAAEQMPVATFDSDFRRFADVTVELD